MARTATIVRETSESKVELSLNLDGTGKTDIDTSVPFYNHMMTALGKHSLIDLTIKATGDTDIDAHHTVEDIAIVFGEALKQALGNKRGIRRFADATVPLDEALAKAVVDISGRPYCVCTGEPEGFEYCMIGGHFDDRDRIFDELLKRGVLIRVVGPEGWMRVCMGTDEEMARFREALVEVLRIVEQG